MVTLFQYDLRTSQTSSNQKLEVRPYQTTLLERYILVSLLALKRKDLELLSLVVKPEAASSA
jgi:hypothetical protein